MSLWVLTTKHKYKGMADWYFDVRDEYEAAKKHAKDIGAYLGGRLDYITDASEFKHWCEENV